MASRLPKLHSRCPRALGPPGWGARPGPGDRDLVNAAALRRALFERLFLNLALVLGVCQALLWQWASIVVAGGEGLSAAGLAGLAALLVAANAVAVRPMRRAFRRRDPLGWLARVYVDAGVSTLLLAATLGAVGLVSLLLAGLLGTFGAGPELASKAF